MAEEKKEPWLNYLALTTVVFAACATLSTLKDGEFSTRSVISQAQAPDQWAYYQAKNNFLREGCAKIIRCLCFLRKIRITMGRGIIIT